MMGDASLVFILQLSVYFPQPEMCSFVEILPPADQQCSATDGGEYAPYGWRQLKGLLYFL